MAKLRQGQTARAEAEARAAGGAPKKAASDEVLVGGQRMLLLKVRMWCSLFCVFDCMALGK